MSEKSIRSCNPPKKETTTLNKNLSMVKKQSLRAVVQSLFQRAMNEMLNL